jgi:DNA (cytosine-5)-methyltransferase 1
MSIKEVKQENMRSIELFAGIGGIALAAEWAGIETVAFCEREPFCQKVLNKRWQNVPIFDDVKTLNRQVLEERGIDVESIELISGGYPCQPFSLAGNREGENDDRHLWPEVKRLLQEIKPTWFVGENVAGHVTLGLDTVLHDLENIGYTWQPFVLPAAAVGANHERYRVFVVAHSNSLRDNTKEECGTNGNREKEMQERKFSQFGPSYNFNHVRNTNSESGPQTNKTSYSIREERNSRESFTGEYRGEPSRKHWEGNQPSVCRMDDGLSRGLDQGRLKALGNAVVPQQIYPIFKTIMEIERMKE